MPELITRPASGSSHRIGIEALVQRHELRHIAEWIINTEGLERLLAQSSRAESDGSIFDRLLHSLDIRVNCSPADLERIPATGPVLLVANHPHGLLDGLILGSLLSRRRPDFRLLANTVLRQIEEVAPFVIPVRVFDGSPQLNWLAARDSMRWLQKGGALAAFPAGEVSGLSGMPPRVVDNDWSSGPAQIAQRASAKIVPAHISGQNSFAFQLAGVANRSLRTLLLGRELLRKRGSAIRVTVGLPSRASDADVSGEYLRRRTYAIGCRVVETTDQSITPLHRAPVAMPQSSRALNEDIRKLGEEALLFSCRDYRVFVACARDLPSILPEIGRLREVTFRDAGEGTGRSTDLDRFDDHYEHLFLWNPARSELVGAYRLGLVDRVTATAGLSGLYSNSLFRYSPHFIQSISPGLELGRSFVRAEYQRTPQALYALWRGIGAYVARHPEVQYLFGPVSISNYYNRGSRDLMVRYFRSKGTGSFAAVAARTPFRIALDRFASEINSLDELNATVSDIEPDGKGIPILLRHYLNLGGRIVGFNVDGSFSDTLDALLVVDLLKAPPRALAKYMGQSQFTFWKTFHKASDDYHQ